MQWWTHLADVTGFHSPLRLQAAPADTELASSDRRLPSPEHLTNSGVPQRSNVVRKTKMLTVLLMSCHVPVA